MSAPRDSNSSTPYVGRFAPSPTGPLHFGSVVTALASYLQARACSGRWLVRIEDIDPPRERPGAAATILRTLERLGLHWDGGVLLQSTRGDAYRRALVRLADAGLTYRCECSRKELGGMPYPGTCRHRNVREGGSHALRIRVAEPPVSVDDELQGFHTQSLTATVGDFVVVRNDGYPAYHLAVVVDDAAQGITQVVRGLDLLDSTPRQIYLQRMLGLSTPSYAHIPLVLDAQGSKLSKQTYAAPIDTMPPASVLVAALEFLGYFPPLELRSAPVATVLNWAQAEWTLARITRASRHAPDWS